MALKRALSKFRPRADDDQSGTGSTNSGRSENTGRSSHSPHRRILSAFLRDRDYTSSSDDVSDDDSSPSGLSKNQQKRLAREQRRQAKSRMSEEHHRTSAEKNERAEEASREETPEMKANYGDLPLLQSSTRPHRTYTRLDDLSTADVGKDILLTARVHIVRRMGPKLVFLVFRQELSTFQGVMHELTGERSLAMIQWAEHIRIGSIVRVHGTVQTPQAPVQSCSLHDIELSIKQLHVIVRREEPVPFSVYEAELSTVEEQDAEGARLSHIPDRTRLVNRILDLRTATSQSVFRLQSSVCNLFRAALDDRGFIEIHSPKLQGSATESGASVFKLDYFGRNAFLAQSPQLAKQMAISADFGRVYEIGAVFRAENSNTHRHLTEYTGLDIEMAIEEHYHEALEVLDATIKHILHGVYSRNRREVEIVKHQFPSDDVVWLEHTPIIRFADGIKLLNDSGWRDDDGNLLSELEDLHTRDEIRLGELVREKYGTDYYILDKFPAGARPFYTMPDPEDPRVTNSFDIFIRGQEIVSGGQRIHDPVMLEEKMHKAGIHPDDMFDYLEGFRWGAPPHAGAGVGLERLLMLLLKLGNIRLASLFHRDPRSFPAKPAVLQLRHPDSSTLNPPWQRGGDNTNIKYNARASSQSDLQPLDELVANYGDSTSTSWGDERFKIWRDMTTGAAIAYVPSSTGHAIVPGNPLCEPSQYNYVISRFLQFLRKETRCKPIWLLCCAEVQNILGEKLGWRSLSCIAEERVDPSHNRAASDGDIGRKIRHAESEGIKIVGLQLGQMVDDDIRRKIDDRINDWRSNRKGTQIHLSEITPWRDHKHRQYFYALDKEGNVSALVALVLLAPRNGMQIKYSFDFPGAPNGTIEAIVTEAIQTASKNGVTSFTFGAGATSHLVPGHNMHGAKVKLFQRTYDTIANQFHLVRKSEFRQKLGAQEEPMYICYPPHAMGSKGMRAVLNFFED